MKKYYSILMIILTTSFAFAGINSSNDSYNLIGEHLNVVIEAGKTNRIEYLKNSSGYDFQILNNSNTSQKFSLKLIEEVNGGQVINSISGSLFSIRNLNGKYLLSIKNSDKTNTKEFIVEFIPIDIVGKSEKNQDKTLNEEPDPYLWINNGAHVVDGKYFCKYQQQSHRIISEAGKLKIEDREDKVIVMDRMDIDGNQHNAEGYGGDVLSSHINDVSEKYSSWISFSLQRGIYRSFDRGWNDNYLKGPEWLVKDLNGEILRQPDRIVVEMIAASEDSLFQLTNVPDSVWMKIPARYGREAVKNSYLKIYGGGGYERANLYFDPDSVLDPGEGIVLDPNDIGSDDFFHPWRVPIPDTLINKGFIRFRFRVEAVDNSPEGYYSYDDYDEFLLDNIELGSPVEGSDVQAIALVPELNYSYYTLNHPFRIPLKAYVQNTMGIMSPNFNIMARVWKSKDDVPRLIDTGFSLYFSHPYGRFLTVPGVPAESLMEFEMPAINYDEMKDYIEPGMNHFFAMLNIEMPGGDIFASNDTVFTEFDIWFDDFLAYDFPLGGMPDNYNSVDEFTADWYGLALPGYSSPYNNEIFQIAGGQQGPGGEIAVKFTMHQKDTVAGFKTYFTRNASGPDSFELAIYNDNNGFPGEEIESTKLEKNKFFDDADNEYKPEELINYYYGIKDNTGEIIHPPILEAGDYWVVVRQLGNTPLNIGGSAFRCGMKVMQVDSEGEGVNNINIFVDPNISNLNISDETGLPGYSNKTIFAYRNDGDEEWTSFSPNTGNPGYGHLNIYGNVVRNSDTMHTYTRGTFAPVLRLIMDMEQIPVGVEETATDNTGISIYPNPSKDFIMITQKNKSINTNIEIFDLSGNRMDCREISDGIYDLRDLSSGAYIILINNNGNISHKIIIKE